MVTVDDVRSFWDSNPLCAEAIPYEPGSPEFFRHHEAMRYASEPSAIISRY